MSTHSRVTIRDVAALAGVSHQTISRVINGSERVSPETRARVEAAIQELGFRPNAIARFMAQGSTRTIACISPNLTDYTFASIIEGAEREARKYDYYLLSASAPDVDTFATLVEQLVASGRTDGLMVINPYADDRWKHLPEGVSTVVLGAQSRTEGLYSVALDDESGGRIAVEHLISLGHRQIAQLTGPLCEDCSRDRSAGYSAAIRAHGLAVDPELIFEGDWSATSGFQAVRSLLEKNISFSGLFAQNDRMAVGSVQALREAGLRVPEDVSVIGFDDMPLASYFDPPLTTIRQDTFAIGREAATLLIRSVEQPETACQHLRLPAELIIRGSTAPVVKTGGE